MEKKIIVQQKIVDDNYVDAWNWFIVKDDVVVKQGEELTFQEAYEMAKKQLHKVK